MRENEASNIVLENIMKLNWGWMCNASWTGLGNSFNITIPATQNLVIQGMRFNKEFKHIECWGHLEPNNNIGTQYKDDIGNPESTSCYGRQSCDGRADGKTQPGESQETLR